MIIKQVIRIFGCAVVAGCTLDVLYEHIFSYFHGYRLYIATNVYGEWLTELIVFILGMICFTYVLYDYLNQCNKKDKQIVLEVVGEIPTEEVVYESHPF